MGRWIVLFDNGKPCGVFEYELDLHIKLLGHKYLTLVTVTDCRKHEAVRIAMLKNRFGSFDQVSRFFEGIDVEHMKYNHFMQTCRRIFKGVLLKKIEENGNNISDAAKQFGLNRKSVYRILYGVPIKMDTIKWTVEEEEFIMKNHKRTHRWIAAQLGRSVGSIESKAQRMGIYRKESA